MGDEAELKKCWKEQKLSSCKLQTLKNFLKGVGLPMAGEHAAVTKRVQMYMDVKYLDLFVMQDGVKTSPFDLKPAQIRKIVAQLGMDPTGDKDELHSLLIERLKSNKNKGEQREGSASSADEPTGVVMAKQILEMQDDFLAILSVSGVNITTDSSVATMRKAYLKISLLIHPDKLQKTFPDATKAFQALVNAYERLSQPELFLEEEEEKKKKDKKIMRSNDGCHRTSIYCPRCKAEWGLIDSGVAEYDYNFMMMGLKTFNCCLCLFEFGCMTAIHRCPFCKKEFEYHPNDYHRKIMCSNEKCKKPFGFFIFHISERMENEYRLNIRRKQEEQLRKKEQLQERQKRAKSRKEEIGAKGKDKLFLLNLLDQCPKCGEDDVEVDLREDHLANCNDKRKIAAYAKQLKEEEEKAEKRSKKKEAEEEAQNAQSWDYLGAKSTEMWMLTEKQVHVMCVKYGIDVTGTKDELIAKIVRHRNSLDSKRMLTDGREGECAAPPSNKRKKLSAADLPSNMESMSVAQLKAVAASHGIVINQKTNKAGIINQIEKQLIGNEPYLMLTDGKKKKK